jgi:hypothetical protein
MCLAAGAYVNATYDSQLSFDIAFLRLSRPIGLLTGWLGASSDCRGNSSLELSTGGYPANFEEDSNVCVRTNCTVSFQPTTNTNATDITTNATTIHSQITAAKASSPATSPAATLASATSPPAAQPTNNCLQRVLFNYCDAIEGQSGSPMFDADLYIRVGAGRKEAAT